MSNAFATISDETPIADVLTSPKNIEILIRNKVTTVGAAKKLSISDFLTMGVGEVTMEEIKSLGVRQAAQSKDSKIEESIHPIHIFSPFGGYSLQILQGDVRRNANGRGQAILKPIYIVCQGGRGQLTRKMWYARKYERDARKVQDAEVANEPWRLEAYEWLRKRKSFGKDFKVMSD